MSASIPGKYQVVFNREDEKKGFTCQTPRFPSHNTNDLPGPGSYCYGSELVDTTGPSFSQNGLGGFASKTCRFSKPLLSKLGPGCYSPQVEKTRVDFSKGDGSNFQKPVVSRKTLASTGPAPNAYKTHNTWDNSSGTAVASFKSRSKRDACVLTTRDNPSPCHYSVKEDLVTSTIPSHCGVFKAKLERGTYIRQNKVPGPGAYSPFDLKEEGTEKKTRTNPTPSWPWSL